LTNRTSEFWKAVFGGGGEVAPAGSDPDDDVRLTGGPVGREGAGGADGPERERVVVGHRALARLGLADGDAGRSTKARSVSVASE
jgi:hypothetical protein